MQGYVLTISQVREGHAVVGRQFEDYDGVCEDGNQQKRRENHPTHLGEEVDVEPEHEAHVSEQVLVP